MKKIFLLGYFSVSLLCASAQVQQENDEIITDRPDETEAAALVPKGALQIETGMMMESDKLDNKMFKEITYNTTLFRYGLTDRVEVRLIQEYLDDEFDGETQAKGFGPLSVGTKIAMMEEKGFFPAISLNAHLGFRTGVEEYKPSHIMPDFRFLFSHTLSKRVELAYNLGAQWDGEDGVTTGVYTLAVGIGIVDRLDCGLEIFGFLPERQSSVHSVGGSLKFLVTNNFQVDLSGGIGLTPGAPDSFILGGLSVRLPR